MVIEADFEALDAYQEGAIELAELQKRRRLVDTKLETLRREKGVLTKLVNEQKQETDVKTALKEFAMLVAHNLKHMSFENQQKLLRLVLDKVVVKDWRVDLYNKIPLPRSVDQPPKEKVSSQFDLRSTCRDMRCTAYLFHCSPNPVLVDSEREQLIVSNIVGHPGVTDAIGYLSRVSLDGTMIERKWVTGLDAPKGMALVGHELLVADLGRLHRIDADTGAIIESLAPDGASFLNDVTSDSDTAWISDLMNNTIWRYSDGTLDPWLQSDELAHPNGLLIEGQRLLVGSWGVGLHDDFSTEEPGALLSVDLATKAISTVVPSLGNIDGIASVQGVLFVSDWISGAVFEVNKAMNSVVEIQRFPKGLADISSNKETLYLPLMLDGQVKAQLTAAKVEE